MAETSLPPYVQASMRIERSPSLRPHRDLLLGFSEDAEHLLWVTHAPEADLMEWVSYMEGQLDERDCTERS
jgi:hypothetical protein